MKLLKLRKKVLVKLKTAVVILSFGILFSCEKEEGFVQETTATNNLTKQEQIDVAKLGYVPEETFKIKLDLPDGSTDEYYSYRDMLTLTSDLQNMVKFADPSLDTEQREKLFRTNNTVGGNRSYTVAFVDFNTPFQQQAAQDMIFLFNTQLRTTIQLNHVFISSSEIASTPRDIMVFYNRIFVPTGLGTFVPDPNVFAGASFPSNFLPGGVLQLNTDAISSISTRETLRQVLMHEILHNFGIQHSDWRTQRSCGENEAENNPFGFVPIPGTNTSGDFLDSIMVACVGSTLGGRGYTGEDVASMREIYGFR
ncbi:M57 family metalloprotease [Aquimarina sp. RZ0]|uniref:M57 family metalloprotease n=1 Tax=Aquimarina sp. RZ0 TaxID=2607730 RepID=UPI0011F3F024|nr:M57 family metalloprotease [Aquimarina sp. RZ0]KAA1243262.1 hypothetical protein F0000_21905 [Aquimarina sp. RZ0]